MDVGIALIVVPIIVGVIAAGVRLGLPSAYEAPVAMLVGLAIFVGVTPQVARPAAWSGEGPAMAQRRA